MNGTPAATLTASSPFSIQSPFRRPDRWPDILWARQTRSRRLRRASGWKQVAPVGAGAHLIDRCCGHEVAIHPYLPSPTERPKHGSETQRNIGQGSGKAILRLQQI